MNRIKLLLILGLLLLTIPASAYSAGMQIEAYSLYREGNDKCIWIAPSGVKYSMYCGDGGSNETMSTPCYGDDGVGENCMVLQRDGINDARIDVTLIGAPGIACWLAHNGDDDPARYIVSTDDGYQPGKGNSAVEGPSFSIIKVGDKKSPLAPWAKLQVVCLEMFN